MRRDLKQAYTLRRITPVRSRSPEKERVKQFEDKQCCDRCGLSHRRGQCPAYGKRCFQCGGMNHFSKFCRMKKVSAVTKEKSHAVGGVGVNKTDGKTTVNISATYVSMEVQSNSK